MRCSDSRIYGDELTIRVPNLICERVKHSRSKGKVAIRTNGRSDICPQCSRRVKRCIHPVDTITTDLDRLAIGQTARRATQKKCGIRSYVVPRRTSGIISNRNNINRSGGCRKVKLERCCSSSAHVASQIGRDSLNSDQTGAKKLCLLHRKHNRNGFSVSGYRLNKSSTTIPKCQFDRRSRFSDD